VTNLLWKEDIQMKKINLSPLIILISMILFIGPFVFGCAPRNYVRSIINKPSYIIGTNQSSPVGSTMLSRETGLKVCWEYWAGLANGGWRPKCDEDVDRFKEELVYAGRAGNIIRIAYKEFKGSESFYLARPAFFQELTYDLASSNLIVFRVYRIRIMNANNESISFVVESDK
jgi:hypothetical protein